MIISSVTFFGVASSGLIVVGVTIPGVSILPRDMLGLDRHKLDHLTREQRGHF